jgi:hypothetical protein
VIIPKALWSAFGPVSVAAGKSVQCNGRSALGSWDGWARTIKYRKGNDASALQAVLHEMIHLALWDAGAHNCLTDKQQELVCDAVGSYLAGAVRAGAIELRDAA